MPATPAKKWTAEEDATLRSELEAGVGMLKIGIKIGRSYKAVRCRAITLGLSRKNSQWKTPEAMAFIARLADEGLTNTAIAKRMKAEIGVSLSSATVSLHRPDRGERASGVKPAPEPEPKPVKTVIDLDGLIIRKTSITVVNTSFMVTQMVQVSVPALSFMGEAA